MADNYWNLLGNRGTDPNTNFVGTADGQPLVINMNGGNVGIGTPGPALTLHVKANNATDAGRFENADSGGYGSATFVNDAGTLFGVGVAGSAAGFAPGQFYITDSRNVAKLVIDTTGNVGIGTTSPIHKLTVAPSSAADGIWLASSGATNVALFSNMESGGWNPLTQAGDDMIMWKGTAADSPTAGGLVLAPWSANSKGIRIDYQGNVGIGTPSPRAKLEVDGDIAVTGDVRLLNADCAEDFEMSGEDVEPGTVMVIDQEGVMEPSRQAYDKRVTGVISGAGDLKPGIILGKQPSENKRMPIALVGKVYCKVDAKYAPIAVGDLLTTSPTPGHAMKADDQVKAFGAVIGKALRPLRAGEGMIPILIALQ